MWSHAFWFLCLLVVYNEAAITFSPCFPSSSGNQSSTNSGLPPSIYLCNAAYCFKPKTDLSCCCGNNCGGQNGGCCQNGGCDQKASCCQTGGCCQNGGYNLYENSCTPGCNSPTCNCGIPPATCNCGIPPATCNCGIPPVCSPPEDSTPCTNHGNKIDLSVHRASNACACTPNAACQICPSALPCGPNPSVPLCQHDPALSGLCCAANHCLTPELDNPFEGIIHDLISAVNQVMYSPPPLRSSGISPQMAQHYPGCIALKQMESLVNHLLASSACGDHKNGHLSTHAHDLVENFTKAQNETAITLDRILETVKANYFGLSATLKKLDAIDAKSHYDNGQYNADGHYYEDGGWSKRKASRRYNKRGPRRHGKN